MSCIHVINLMMLTSISTWEFCHDKTFIGVCFAIGAFFSAMAVTIRMEAAK